MNTSQILSLLKSDQALQQICVGVFPIDQIPPCKTVPAAYVINLDKHDEPGSHWVALYVNQNSKCEYFDSYGREPNDCMLEYIKENSISFKWNKKIVQKYMTASCGQICIYYLVWRIRGILMSEIVDSLEQSYADEYVTAFVNSLFKINTIVYDNEFVLDQICRMYKS